MKIHLSCGAIGVKADMRQAIDYAAKYGFDVIDADSRWLRESPEAEVAKLLDYMRTKKVGWGLAGLPVDFRKDDAAFADGMKTWPATVQALKRAGVDRVTTWISPTSPQVTYVTNFRTHARRLGEVAKALNDSGLRFGLEYVGPKTSWTARKYPFIHTLAEMRDLIAEMKQPNVGLVMDSWHWYTAGDTAEDILALKASDVVSVDLNDAPAGLTVDQQIDSKRELPGATGVIDAKTFLGCLAKIGFDGPVRAEPFNEALRKMEPEAALAKTIEAMKKTMV